MRQGHDREVGPVTVNAQAVKKIEQRLFARGFAKTKAHFRLGRTGHHVGSGSTTYAADVDGHVLRSGSSASHVKQKIDEFVYGGNSLFSGESGVRCPPSHLQQQPSHTTSSTLKCPVEMGRLHAQNGDGAL